MEGELVCPFAHSLAHRASRIRSLARPFLSRFLASIAFNTSFDTATQSFQPLRKGLQTELVDFGGWEGINGLNALVPYFAMAGWLPGKDLFAAPFDWRVPSGGQAEFHSKLKTLVEQTFTASGGRKVVLWAFSFGPQVIVAMVVWPPTLVHE